MKTSAIVAALNEGPRIGAVVRTLVKCRCVDEVVAVDDGSVDETPASAMAAGATVISLPKNIGKGGAVAKGLEATDGEIILLIDADLIGLTSKHIIDLLGPVKDGTADMTIGVFRGGRLTTHFSNAIAQKFSGQRAFKRDMVSPKDLELSRYGLEELLSQTARKKSLRVRKVILDDLSQVTKEEKMGFSRGSRLRMIMYSEVILQFFRKFMPVR